MLEEIETEETRDFFVIGDISIGSGGQDPWLHLYAGQFVLEIRKLLAASEAEFNSLIGAGMGSKLFRTKEAVIFAFLEKFGREGARRLR